MSPSRGTSLNLFYRGSVPFRVEGRLDVSSLTPPGIEESHSRSGPVSATSPLAGTAVLGADELVAGDTDDDVV